MSPPSRASTLAAGGVLALALLPWARYGAAWPETVVQHLDHCRYLGCDFRFVYLEQVLALAEGSTEIHRAWFYPPLLAVLLQGFAWFETEMAVAVWSLLEGLAAAGIGVFAWRALGGKGWRHAAWALALTSLCLPVLHAWKWGQVSLFLVLAGLWALPRKGRGPTLVLALTAAVKLYPLAWLAQPSLHRHLRRVLAVLVLVPLLGVGIPLLALGPDLTLRFYLHVLHFEGVHAPPLGGQALSPTLYRMLVDGEHIALGRMHPPRLLDLPGLHRPLVVGSTLLLGAITARQVVRRRDAPELCAVLVLLTLALLLPPGWHHYFAFLPWGVAVVLGHTGFRSLPGGLALVAWTVTALPVLLLADVHQAYFHYSAWGGTTVSGLLLWLAAVLASTRKG